MLTVKLVRGNFKKIVEAETVNLYPAGKRDSVSPDQPAPLSTIVCGISCMVGGKAQDFYVGPAEETEDRWDYAYIENAQGATTERVYPIPDYTLPSSPCKHPSGTMKLDQPDIVTCKQCGEQLDIQNSIHRA